MKLDVKISARPLDAAACAGLAAGASSGATALFIGTVRDETAGRRVVRLDFEAYEPMALREMRKLGEAAFEKWPVLHALAIHHRVGPLEIGEAAVVIAASAGHRDAAFAACRWAIDELKRTVPIWKKEVFEDGEVWVAAHP